MAKQTIKLYLIMRFPKMGEGAGYFYVTEDKNRLFFYSENTKTVRFIAFLYSTERENVRIVTDENAARAMGAPGAMIQIENPHQ